MKIARTLAALLLAAPAAAQDFSAGSEAQSWNLYAESPARFQAVVVDPLCTLAGDCPADCGGGARQLALLRSADKVMVLPLKNTQPLFTGAATELAPFCGKTVEVDGLLLTDPDAGLANVFQLQTIREAGSPDWIKADSWTKDWASRNPDLAAGDGPWFRRDPRVTALIEANGWFGLGIEKDKAILQELYP
jgi:hypothetical protein